MGAWLIWVRFPADGWPRHVTWAGRWRLPQTVRAGSESLLLQPPCLLSWDLRSLSAPRTYTFFLGFSSFPPTSFPWCVFRSLVLHSGSGGAPFPRRIPGWQRRTPTRDLCRAKGWGSPEPSLSPIWMRQKAEEEILLRERRCVSVDFSLEYPIEGSIP